MLEDGLVISAIIEKRKALSPQHALLVGISGIDAAGKGFVTARIAELLEKGGVKLAVINADGWLNLHMSGFTGMIHQSTSTRMQFDSMRCSIA